MRLLKGLKRAAIARVEATIVRVELWPIKVRKSWFKLSTLTKYTSAREAVRDP
jgi:hypothetical protein